MGSSHATPYRVLRIVDANINRAAEGLRLLEDVARLLLDDGGLTGRLKTMRHGLAPGDWQLQLGLIGSRDAAGDVGMDASVTGESGERGLAATVVANARRAQESLRTLEEMAKLPELSARLDSEAFKHTRFELYSVEQELVGRLTRADRAAGVRGLYVIVDTALLAGRSHLDVAARAIRGGARTIQLRDKTAGTAELLAISRELQALCRREGALFVMNDYLHLALAAETDGLHQGQKDMPPQEARRLLPPTTLLGCSATSVEIAVAAAEAGADYIAVGSMYATSNKATAVVVGPEMLRRVREAVSRPLVAIGGINEDNVAEVMAAGADAVAVIGAVVAAPDPEQAARRLVSRMETGGG